MCGICGVLRLDGQSVQANAIIKMSTAIAHRGPDGEGVWTAGPIGLGHRRLAIIDLTPAGHQPMCNESADIVIVYNGELYNHLDLRRELEIAGHHFHSRSDTETIIHAYEEWGNSCLDRFNGMFAFAIWDARENKIFLARDRYGIKPLYYFFDGAKFIFGSEIKAILAYPGVPRKICYPALNEYFTFQNILSDLTLFDGIKILSAGMMLEINLEEKPDRKNPTIKKYWDFNFSQQSTVLTCEEETERLYTLFVQAVRRQLMSDVPIASYLSGGMDSGSITAVAREHLGRLLTFTGGFDLSSATGLEFNFDERTQSEVLSNLLKTEHYEIVMHAGDMEEVMPDLIWHLEDLRVGQCYPNYYVSRLSGKFVKVVLSGAGGDELFGGYPWRYYHGLKSNGNGNGFTTEDYYQNYYNFWQRLVSDDDKQNLFNENTLKHIGNHSTYECFKKVFTDSDLPAPKTLEDYINHSLYFELKTFLHGLLVVEDKISMAHSLETRVPFLDNDLVDFACKLPPRYKLSNLGQIDQNVNENDLRKYQQTKHGKMILRHAMERLIPAEVTERVKQGFSAPDASWFRGESIDYINKLLRNPDARIYEFLNHEYVDKKLDEHSSGKENHRLFIWSLISFEWWLRMYMV